MPPIQFTGPHSTVPTGPHPQMNQGAEATAVEATAFGGKRKSRRTRKSKKSRTSKKSRKGKSKKNRRKTSRR